MSLAIDPWAEQPIDQEPTAFPSLLTPTELSDIRDEVWDSPWHDPTRFNDCLRDAFETLGVIALESADPESRRAATQSLRRMHYRTLNGIFQHEVDTHG